MTGLIDAHEAGRLLDASIEGELPDERGRFGPFGGRYIPETLVPAFERLEEGVKTLSPRCRIPGGVQAGTARMGRPPDRLDLRAAALRTLGDRGLAEARGPRAYGRAQDQQRDRPGAAREALGAERVIAETGAGQHGVASAAACARVGLPCRVYMGAVDIERQAPNVDRMQRLGAEVVPVESGDKTLRAAIDEALRNWVSDPARHLLPARLGGRAASLSLARPGTAVGDRREAREQMLERAGGLPDATFACVGGGSNAIGCSIRCSATRHELIGVEAGGTGRVWARMRRHSRPARRACCRAVTRSSCRTRRPGAGDAFDLGRARLLRRRSGACAAASDRPGDLHNGERRRGARGAGGTL